jgi:S-adenosylmethionine decarboxylase
MDALSTRNALDIPRPITGMPPGSLLSDRSMRYVGTHLLLDLWGGEGLDNPDFVAEAMRECAKACGATLLSIHVHHFGESEGVTGVAVLAESHISIHSWPEHGYAAFDVFVCGALDPYPGIDALVREFRPSRTNVIEHRRGLSSRCPCTGL